jgi:hypothetical protein
MILNYKKINLKHFFFKFQKYFLNAKPNIMVLGSLITPVFFFFLIKKLVEGIIKSLSPMWDDRNGGANEGEQQWKNGPGNFKQLRLLTTSWALELPRDPTHRTMPVLFSRKLSPNLIHLGHMAISPLRIGKV